MPWIVAGLVDHVGRGLDVDAAPAEDVVGDLAAGHAAAGLGAGERHGGLAQQLFNCSIWPASLGSSEISSATAPATCGEAIEVP